MAEHSVLTNCATAYIMQQLGTSGDDGAQTFQDFLRTCDVKAKLELTHLLHLVPPNSLYK